MEMLRTYEYDKLLAQELAIEEAHMFFTFLIIGFILE